MRQQNALNTSWTEEEEEEEEEEVCTGNSFRRHINHYVRRFFPTRFTVTGLLDDISIASMDCQHC
jgi:hypothetical protein